MAWTACVSRHPKAHRGQLAVDRMVSALQSLLPIFAQTVLPVFLVAAAGLALAHAMRVDGQSLGRVLFYLATPSLVFRSLYQLDVDSTAVRHLALVALIVIVGAGVAGWFAGFDQVRNRRLAIVLTSAVSNNGNMGMPICLFAFGETGLALATVYYVFSTIMNNTIGVVVASSGRAPLMRALRQTLRVPALYTTVLALSLNASQVEMPVSIFRAVDLLANAAIPGMLVLLGIQLRSTPLFQSRGIVLRSAAVRLLFGPLLAWLACTLLGVSGLERSVLITQAAMPTAVITSVLATEFDTAPTLVATAIFVSTLFSMVTVSLILSLLR